MPITAVFFDVGETLVDETRMLADWAHWLDVPLADLHQVLAGVIARDEHHRRVFEILRPGFDIARAIAERRAQGREFVIGPGDLYPDAFPAMASLQAAGIMVAVAGNQPPRSEAALKAMGLPADLVAGSSTWGIEKPKAAFFERVVAAAGRPAHEIAYVGDRLDNDILPARAAGLVTVLVRRGPWGRDHARRPAAAAAADRIVDDLNSVRVALQEFS